MTKIKITSSLYNAILKTRDSIHKDEDRYLNSRLGLLGGYVPGVFSIVRWFDSRGGCDFLPHVDAKQLTNAFYEMQLNGCNAPYAFVYITESDATSFFDADSGDMGDGFWIHKDTPFISITHAEVKAYISTEYGTKVQEVGIVPDYKGQPVPKEKPTTRKVTKRVSSSKKSVRSKGKSNGSKNGRSKVRATNRAARRPKD